MKSTSWGDRIFDIANYSLLAILGVVTLYPFLNVLAISLNDTVDTVRGGITIFPRELTFANYREIFGYPALLWASFISVLRTAVGTASGILCTAMLAFSLSRDDFIARKPFTTILVITMYVSGGMIPDYMLVRMLGLTRNFLVYILPGLIAVFNVIVLRSYITTLPIELQESGKLDGANDLVIFWRIVFPLCTPVVATLSLFIAVDQWNSWFDTYLYCSSVPALTTLQFELQKMLSNAQSTGRDMYHGVDSSRQARVSPESIRMAMTIVATLPILFVYPSVQKYFIKGLTLGAVKS
jgi:putative aldouronate transport system permease protein